MWQLKATAPFAYAYVCPEGWADEEEYDDEEAELPERKNQTIEDHLDQLDTESDVLIDSTTVW